MYSAVHFQSGFLSEEASKFELLEGKTRKFLDEGLLLIKR